MDKFKNSIRLFSGSSNPKLATKIADLLNVPLADITPKFSCGENYARISESIRGHDVYVIQSIGLNPNDDYMELF